MNKIISALAAAIIFVIGIKAKLTEALATVKERDKTIDERNASIAEKDKRIADLLAAIDAENADDSALQKAAADARAAQTEAEARAKEREEEAHAARQALSELETGITEATAKADSLTTEISADPDIPITVGADGQVSTGEVAEPFNPPVPKGAE